MNRKQFLISYKTGFALLALIAMIAQLANVLENQDLSTVNFFGYFTILSNLFAVAIFLMSAHALYSKRNDPELEALRGAATFYMLTTGVIYNLLLRGVGVHTPIPWVNFVLHDLFPVVVFLDWIYDPPKREFTHKRPLLWLTFPLAYAAYSLIRGHFAHWYPYPFIDASKYGYAQVILNCLLIAVGMFVAAEGVGRLPHVLHQLHRHYKKPSKRSA